jgi:uncharacterized surface protein with fasciclin (FAS1) repeats
MDTVGDCNHESNRKKLLHSTRKEHIMKKTVLTRLLVCGMLIVSLMTVGALSSVSAMGEKDIVDTAVAAGSFTTLATALKAADLITTLKGPGPFTVFAPTDAAFAKLPAGTLDSLLKPESKAKLQGILTYHVVSGKVMAADVVKLNSAKTVNGQSLTIMVKDGAVMADNAKVTKTDIMCTNGVIHIIDAVVLPK